MSRYHTKPVSAIIKSKDSDEPKKQSREEWKKEKELEEARKLGNAPAAVDEEGRDINPHIPQYISEAPWYAGTEGPTLTHQRQQPETVPKFSGLNEYYQRGILIKTATKYRKGACENCGSMTHKKKDCLERPRKIGAKYTSEEIAPDEPQLPDLNLDYDGKRDRWNGYDPSNYQQVVEEFAKIEEAKRQLKEEKLRSADNPAEGANEEEEDASEDEDKYADNIDMPGTKVDSKQRITVRNLRIREDVAKYLRNLDPNSAHYDPKTRSMRDNPYKNTGKEPTDLSFAGDNFVRISGDTTKVANAQLFAWQAYEKGVDVHMNAEPTKAEILNKEYETKKEQLTHSTKDSLLERYGGKEHLEAPPKELIFAQTEQYVEYSRRGELIKGVEKPVIKSQYEEDVYINNHTTVWGSYWRDGRWGYKCCHSFLKNSYCTGVSGKVVAEMTPASIMTEDMEDSAEKQSQVASTSSRVVDDVPSQVAAISDDDDDKPVKKRKVEKDNSSSSSSSESSSSSSDDDDDDRRSKTEVSKSAKKKKRDKKREKKRRKKEKRKAKKAKKARNDDDDSSDDDEKSEKKIKTLMKKMKAQDERQEMDDRKRKYNSMYDYKAPTEDDMEAYYRNKTREDDPMANFL